MPNRTPSWESLIALPDRGAKGLPDILRMAANGNWQTRALAVSAAGRIARDEPALLGAWAYVVRRLPAWRRRFPAAGARGRFVRNKITDGLVDRSWPVRVAAALAIGECRASARVPRLRRLLKSHLRAERIAAACAILRCGGHLDISAESLLADAASVPALIGESTASRDFLTALASAHVDVLETWRRVSNDQPAGSSPSDWAAFLAGSTTAPAYTGPTAEIERYDAEGEVEYLLTKPFSHINRTQNVRLLHSFLVASEHLEVPPGGRILDLGGGSAWVSELLATYGYQPFTLDLSASLLGIGTQRFARKGLTRRFVVGDMTRLPVATRSMDAVIVMDALHHVPDVPAVFHEAFRVLIDGGQFILAEPGEGHSETEKSRGEMLEHGVLEREIHVRDAIEMGRAAGFDRILVVPHYVPGIAMTPAQMESAMSAPADEWKIQQGDQPGFLSAYLLQSMFSRPILVLRKGHRLVDSRVPRTLKADLSARLARTGSVVRGIVTVRNTGDTIWLGGGDAVGHVRVGIQLLNADQRVMNREFGRVPLAGPIKPGGTAEIQVEVTVPDARTAYVLKIDLVAEGICWFEDEGSKPAYVTLPI